MQNLEKFIVNVSDNLDRVFEDMNSTVEFCNLSAKEAGSILRVVKGTGRQALDAVVEVEKLKEAVVSMATLFQFGDIISQSFESFDVIFEELERFKSTEKKLDLEQAERFAKLLGAVSTSTFSLIGTTLLQLKEQLDKADRTLKIVEKIIDRKDYSRMASDSRAFILSSADTINKSAKYTVEGTGKMGLFCVQSIISNSGISEDSGLVKRLYEKFRVRMHVEILNEMFPENKEYSNTGSLELF